jgi:hypothetical protein
MIRIAAHPWLRLAVTTGAGLAVWGLAAAHGYGWSTIWLPAVVAGAAWPPSRRTRDQCRSQAHERRSRR